MGLTVIILARENDIKLKKALESVNFADEVIVVKEKFLIKDFSKARNSSLARAKGEWVLFVDSDEIISEKLSSEIKSQISNPPARNATHSVAGGKSQSQNSKLKTNPVVGFYFKRRDYFLGKWLNHGETAGVKLLRLAKKDAGGWVRPVHEEWKVEGNIGELKNPLLHDSHDNVLEMAEKLDRYSEMEAEYKNGQIGKYTNRQIDKWMTLIQMATFPIGKFVWNYIFRMGFLDGMEGFIHAGMMSGHSFMVRAKILRRKQETENRKQKTMVRQ